MIYGIWVPWNFDCNKHSGNQIFELKKYILLIPDTCFRIYNVGFKGITEMHQDNSNEKIFCLTFSGILF